MDIHADADALFLCREKNLEAQVFYAILLTKERGLEKARGFF